MNPLWYVLIAVLVIVMIIVTATILKKRKGNIIIQLQQTAFSPGGTIQGELLLTVKKPIQAKELSISLRGERITRSRQPASKGTSTHTDRTIVANIKQIIHAQKDYAPSQQSFPFEIKIPQESSLASTINNVFRSVEMLQGKNSRTEWSLFAELACPGLNITRRMPIHLNTGL